MTLLPEAKEELLQCARDSGGILTAEAVVEYARSPSRALHSLFDWNDSSAAAKYRLDQARFIIRKVHVRIENAEASCDTRYWISLPSDRKPDHAYRPVVSVLSERSKRAEFLETVVKELRRIRQQYGMLTELATIWSAIDRWNPENHQPSGRRYTVHTSK